MQKRRIYYSIFNQRAEEVRENKLRKVWPFMNFNRFPLLIIVIMLGICMSGAPVNAEQDKVGTITKVMGQVTILRDDDKEITGEKGLPILPGDQLTTDKKSAVWFTLNHEREFRLGEDAQMSVDELSGPEVEDGYTILRLVLGYLWCKAQKIRQKVVKWEVHTPTAVLGVRGTEFDTVVSLDGTSVIAVDEGSVAVESKDESIALDTGTMTHVELDAKPSLPLPATPRDKRDWQAWRKKRVRLLFQRLPKIAPRLRNKFEMLVNRLTGFTGRVENASNKIKETMERVEQAKRSRDRQKFIQSARQLKRQVHHFKMMAFRFRRRLNRVMVLGKLSYRIELFTVKNKKHYSDQELAVIEENLAIISEKRVEITRMSRRIIRSIRQTFRELRQFKGKMQQQEM